VPAVAISVPTDESSIVEGRRLAAIHGCIGCHGKQVEGRVLFDEPFVGRLNSPNLTSAARRYSDAELAVAIRNGPRPGGRTMFVMPSDTYLSLTDEDLGQIIAYLKSLPLLQGPDASAELGPLGRIGLVTGQLSTAATLIAQRVDPPKVSDEVAAFGRYLAVTVCGHCHGASLRGTSNPEFTSPSLQIVAAYSPAAFAELLRTGVALGGRELGLMSPISRAYFSQLTDAEVAALYKYPHALPDDARN
jgi:cytochrome c553